MRRGDFRQIRIAGRVGEFCLGQPGGFCRARLVFPNPRGPEAAIARRAGWCFVFAATVLFLGSVSRESAGGLWPHALAARGALIGAASYLIWTIRRNRQYSHASSFLWSGAFALVGTYWCCIRITRPGTGGWLDLAGVTVGASVIMGAMASLATLAAIGLWRPQARES